MVVNNDAVSWRVLTRMDFDAIVLSPGPGHPSRWHDFGVCSDILRKSEVPGLRDLPWPPGHRQPPRGNGQPGADGDARPPQPGHARRQGPLQGRAAGILGGSLSLAGDHQPARAGREHRRLVRRRCRDGGRAHQAADLGSSVPPRVDLHRVRAEDRPELLRAGGELPAAGGEARGAGDDCAAGGQTGAADRREGRSRGRAGAADADPGGPGADRARLRKALRRARSQLLARQRRRPDLARPVLLHGHHRRGRPLLRQLRRRPRRGLGRPRRGRRRSSTSRSSTTCSGSWAGSRSSRPRASIAASSAATSATSATS